MQLNLSFLGGLRVRRFSFSAVTAGSLERARIRAAPARAASPSLIKKKKNTIKDGVDAIHRVVVSRYASSRGREKRIDKWTDLPLAAPACPFVKR